MWLYQLVGFTNFHQIQITPNAQSLPISTFTEKNRSGKQSGPSIKCHNSLWTNPKKKLIFKACDLLVFPIQNPETRILRLKSKLHYSQIRSRNQRKLGIFLHLLINKKARKSSFVVICVLIRDVYDFLVLQSQLAVFTSFWAFEIIDWIYAVFVFSNTHTYKKKKYQDVFWES